MSATIYFRDGTQASIASGTQVKPYSENGVISPAFIEIRNSSQAVAIVATEVAKYVEIAG